MYLHIRLLEEEAIALKQVADQERRPARQQAAFLIRESLARRGLLPETAVNDSTAEEVENEQR